MFLLELKGGWGQKLCGPHLLIEYSKVHGKVLVVIWLNSERLETLPNSLDFMSLNAHISNLILVIGMHAVSSPYYLKFWARNPHFLQVDQLLEYFSSRSLRIYNAKIAFNTKIRCRAEFGGFLYSFANDGE